VDLGLANAAVIHDGATTRVIEPGQALRKNLKKLRRLDRELARKQRGSANREMAKLRRARLLYRVSCQRQEMLHELSSELARAKRVIVLEDLHVKGMQRNKHLGLSFRGGGFGAFGGRSRTRSLSVSVRTTAMFAASPSTGTRTPRSTSAGSGWRSNYRWIAGKTRPWRGRLWQLVRFAEAPGNRC
jgi:hypothetical protein